MLRNMRPQTTMNNSQDDLLGYVESGCQFQGTFFSRSVYSANIENICFPEFRSRIAGTLMNSGMFSVIATCGFFLFGYYFWLFVGLLPSFSPTGFPGHSVSPVIFTATLALAATSLIIPVSHVIQCGTRKKMLWPDASGIIAFVTTLLPRLCSIFQKPRYTVGNKGNYFFIDLKSKTTVICPHFSPYPNPTIAIGAVPWGFIYFTPKTVCTIFRKWWDNSQIVLHVRTSVMGIMPILLGYVNV